MKKLRVVALISGYPQEELEKIFKEKGLPVGTVTLIPSVTLTDVEEKELVHKVKSVAQNTKAFGIRVHSVFLETKNIVRVSLAQERWFPLRRELSTRVINTSLSLRKSDFVINLPVPDKLEDVVTIRNLMTLQRLMSCEFMRVQEFDEEKKVWVNNIPPIPLLKS
ncbi:MAG: hypothetical protein H6791_01280 [Candidatus Nomurabacteria bacterium]|nr:MAG: hypothetical protein H6791_01280 [Candidatus Nomurabacteria bacterium]